MHDQWPRAKLEYVGRICNGVLRTGTEGKDATSQGRTCFGVSGDGFSKPGRWNREGASDGEPVVSRRTVSTRKLERITETLDSKTRKRLLRD